MSCVTTVFGLSEPGELLNLTWVGHSDGGHWEDHVTQVMKENLVSSAIVLIALVDHEGSHQYCYKVQIVDVPIDGEEDYYEETITRIEF